MIRTIPLKIQNEYITGDKGMIGAAGSHNDVILRMEFSGMWDGLTKMVQFRDALGEATIEVLLTADMLEADDTSVYLVPVPNGAKKYAGEMTLCIKGAAVSAQKETRATLAVYGRFTVAESKWSADAETEADVPASNAEQLQWQIENVLSTIVDARKAATEAAKSAEGAALSQSRAQTSEQYAGEYAQDAADSAIAAANSATSAGESAAAAASSATAAESSATAAKASEDAAAGSAANAAASATSAGNSAANAANSASVASSDSTKAKKAAFDAQAAKSKAEDSQVAAKLSENNAAGSAASAAESIKHAPRINANGKWELWDATTNAYVATEYTAIGEDGVRGRGWYQHNVGTSLVQAVVWDGSIIAPKWGKGDWLYNPDNGNVGICTSRTDNADGSGSASITYKGTLKGTDGITPHIGTNGNWYIGDTDTGKPSRGAAGAKGDPGAKGEKGDPGKDGTNGITPTIGANGNWFLGTTDTNKPSRGATGAKGDPGAAGAKGDPGEPGAAGKDGTTPHIGANGNWYIGSTDTGVSAKGVKGDKGDPGSDADVTSENIAAALGYIPAKKDTLDEIISDCLETVEVPGENYNLFKASQLIVKRRLVTGSTENVESSNYYNFVLKSVPVKYGKYYRGILKVDGARVPLKIERINRVQKDGTVIADSYVGTESVGDFFVRPASEAVWHVNDPDTVAVEVQFNLGDLGDTGIEVKSATDLTSREAMIVDGDTYADVMERSVNLPYLDGDAAGVVQSGYAVKPDARKADASYALANRKMIHSGKRYDADFIPNDRFLRAISNLRGGTAKTFTLSIPNTSGAVIKNAIVAVGLHNTAGVTPANNNAPLQIYDDVFSAPTGIKFFAGDDELPYYIESESDCNYIVDKTVKTGQKALAVFPNGKLAVWNDTSSRMQLSADDGATWTNICSNITSIPYRILLPDSQNNLFVASNDGKYLYKYTSADGYLSGTTVIDMSALDTQIGSILAEDSEGNLYIGTYQAAPWHCVIRKSTDHGDTWSIVFDTTTSQHVHNIYVNRRVTPNEIFIGLDNNSGYVETYVSKDAGATWTKISESIPYRNCDYAFRYAGENFYIGCGERNVLGGAALYKTTDYTNPDAYYTLFDNGQGIRDVTNVIDGSDNVLIAGGCVGDPVMAEQLFLSEDRGETWKTVYFRPYPTKLGIAGAGLRTLSKRGNQILSQTYTDYALRFAYGGGAKTILAIVNVGDVPAGGKTITLKTGYVASIERMDKVLTAYEQIDGKVADIQIKDGCVVDMVSGKRVLTDKTEYVEANTRIGQTPENKVLATSAYRLKGSVNLGKLTRLNFSKGFTVSLLFRKEMGKNYLNDANIYTIIQSGDTKLGLQYRSLVLMDGADSIFARKLYLDDSYLNSVDEDYVRVTVYVTDDDLPTANIYTSNSWLSAEVTCTSYPITDNLSAYDLIVGDTVDGAPDIARIEIYNRVLTHGEILALTAGGNYVLGSAEYTTTVDGEEAIPDGDEVAYG